MLASLPHYEAHVWHVWRHLPVELRGEMVTGRHTRISAPDPDDIVLVGGYYDIDRARGLKTIYIEHGAGQSYQGDPKTKNHPAYHGSKHPSNVIGYISPRHSVAESWGPPAVAVGSPVCDLYVDSEPENVAVFAFHWDCHIIPETRSAYPHYAEHLGQMVRHVRDAGFNVVACSHPRDVRMPIVWKNLGVERVDASAARERAKLIIADNTSLAYELCHLGRSAITLNAPWYRRDVEHGLRFWVSTPGIGVNGPEHFLHLDVADYIDSPVARVFAKQASHDAYDLRPPGHAGVNAAQWIVDLLGEYGHST
jgi:hypothetical protein